ncbi:hypothetical protein DSM112329_04749 [Paraconexibacter sp. AEG42_29]|uniref:Phage resistance protein n=1 Tax=Paraconexibacter sp. AEG42_29 TaxID=2997339 RepID=A0AAU7B1I2_9ACTN
MPTLLRELINIPESVQRGDFVMSLASGVNDKAGTLNSYVVTPQLEDAFEHALTFIASSVRDGRCRAAYLDGSFGSGKSHFMAVLHLLLQRDPDARAIPELARAVSKPDKVLEGKKFALVPLHLIGADSMEQGILGGYVEHLHRIAPTAPPPGVYSDGPIFEQADSVRADIGDEKFFARLNPSGAGADGDDGWGDLAAAWTAETYDAARNAPAGDPGRSRLSGELVSTIVPAFRDAMRGRSTGYVDLEAGLQELARHAKSRGADALILFLDELILWLGTRIGDPAFVAREGQKLIKLIEYTGTREIPVISFVARQRDLREFIGDQIPGSEKLSFTDTLKHWEGRFDSVKLNDRNLPKIAQRRLLAPNSEASKQQLEEAFADSQRTRPDVLDVLMTEDGDRDLFRATYPFSPAFMKALVAASSALQRERTALKVMLQLLVDRRDDLKVGDLVSVGDLFDVLANGDEPFSQDMKRHFDHAKELYQQQLEPLLLAETPGASRPSAADERLVKTLLLAALVPNAGPLRNLDVAKLTALNHGSIASPIPGQEKAIVLQKLRKWSSQVGALKVGEDTQNPTVAIRLTGVDVDAIIERASGTDNEGVRRQLIKELVLSQLGIDADTRLFAEHTVLWRGTRRPIDVVFGNIRDSELLPDDALRASGDHWKLVIDYPFDQGHTPLDDVQRLDRWREVNGASQTVCWVPAFFSAALQRDLKRLGIVRYVLKDERLSQFTQDMSPQDRQQAAGILSDLRSALEQRVAAAIRQAYGVETVAPDTIDTSHGVEDRLQSLTAGFRPQVPVGAQLSDALTGLVDQMLSVQYPAHPKFEDEVRMPHLRVVLEEVQRAAQTTDGRIEVPTDRRKVMRKVAAPLKLGMQYEAPFVLGSHWKDTLERAAAIARTQGAERMTVKDVRAWIAAAEPMGLPRDVESLVILCFAAQTGRVFQLHGGPATPPIDRLDDALELVVTELPSVEAWDTAVERAASILGVTSVNRARNPSSYEALVGKLRDKARLLAPDAEALVPVLGERLGLLGVDLGSAPRMRSARAAASIVSGLATASDPGTVIAVLAEADIPTSAPALARSMSSAGAVRDVLQDSNWNVIGLTAERATAGDPNFQRIATALVRTLERDEHAEPLGPAVQTAASDAIALLAPPPTGPPPGPPPPEPPVAPPPTPPKSGVTVEQGEQISVDVASAQRELDRLATLPGEVLVTLHWTITTNDER